MTMLLSPQVQRALAGFSRLLATSVCVALLATACAEQQVSVVLNEGRASAFGFRDVAPTPAPMNQETAAATATGSLADLVRPLPPIVPGTFPTADDVNRPIGLRAPTIAVEDAQVVDVGVDDNGFMAIPGADEVGWYQYGPTPGERGSSVLAAHIAYNGQDGVFRNLLDLAVGDEVVVLYEDESEQAFEILGIVQYDKDSVPLDDLFERSGQSRLVLITCGGDFNPGLRSYDDNIIAYAVPVAST